jgi:hypothetical protein
MPAMADPTAADLVQARAAVWAGLRQHLHEPALSVLRSRAWVECVVSHVAQVLGAARAEGVAQERARIRRHLLERGPHHVDCPAETDRTAACVCLVEELLTVVFAETRDG